MSRKIIGVTVGTTLPKPNFKQTDPTKGDYIKNKPDFDGLKSKVEQIEVRVDTMQENAYDDTELRGVVSENVARIDTLNELVGNTKVETQIGDAVATLESEIDNKLNTMQSAIDSKVDAEDGKGLSTNDYTTSEKDKLATVEDYANFYEHPAHDSHDLGLYKVTVDDEGHVSNVALVEKEDIVALGIPAQDTTYEEEISDLSDRIDDVENNINTTNETLTGLSQDFENYKTTNNEAVSTNASGIEANKTAIEEIQSDYLTSENQQLLQDGINEVSEKATANAAAIEKLNGDEHTEGSVKQSINTAFNEFAAKISDDKVVNTYKELIDYAATHGPEFTELVGKVDTIDTHVGEIETDLSNYKTAVSDQFAEVDTTINTMQEALDEKADLEHAHEIGEINSLQDSLDGLQADIDAKADLEHEHNDLYYTKDEILESITVDDIDDICGSNQIPDGDFDFITGCFVAQPEAPSDTSVLWLDTDDNSADSGGNAAISVTEPAEDDIPKVFFGAALPQTKDDTIMSFRYISKTKDISGYCKTKAQGSSSMQFPKKNQTTKLYKDAACTEELKVDFKGWGEQNKFCFKANWIDHSHTRNIIGARLWDMIVSNRADYDTLPVEMRNSPNNGAIDGFPVKLYADGVYQGVYTLNIPKDAWMWNMDENNPNHVLLCGEVNNNGEEVDTSCNFRKLWNSDNAWEWDVEIGERTEAIASSFNDLITCIKDTDDETFKSTIGNHLDIQSAIDYWIHQYIICGLDGLGKNLLMATFDGTKWICGAYDMDSTFGLYYDGSKFISTQYRCPEDYQENRSLLWERITTLFADEVKTRYTELRDKVYNYANLFNHFERFTDVIGSDLYAEDLIVFPDIPSAASNNIRQIRAYMKERLYYTDLQFGLMEIPEPEKTIVATNYIQSASDNATTFELYNGAVDWNTQGLSVELSVEHTNQDGNIFFIGENLNSHDDDFLFKTWYWDNVQYMDIYIQSNNVNGDWNQCNVVKVSDYITDWSNIQIEVNKNGIFVNGNDIAGKAKAPDVYALLFERLMSKTTLQIGKKNADKLHPATFKSVYFYNLGIE